MGFSGFLPPLGRFEKLGCFQKIVILLTIDGHTGSVHLSAGGGESDAGTGA
ncbi:UNVERIFIED_ORG: uncharacterized membrane protein YqaE (UPF0057 family) [Arthrobacter globiformis]|nr:uncharacterized membrane protein YqaE (UPF0057 family) [Arthrobacter globiformis]